MPFWRAFTAAVHQRAAHSAAVAEIHGAFHAAADGYLVACFRRAGLGAGEARRAAQVLMAMVEGIHLHEPDRDPAARDELIRWTLRRLAPLSASRSADARRTTPRLSGGASDPRRTKHP